MYVFFSLQTWWTTKTKANIARFYQKLLKNHVFVGKITQKIILAREKFSPQPSMWFKTKVNGEIYFSQVSFVMTNLNGVAFASYLQYMGSKNDWGRNMLHSWHASSTGEIIFKSSKYRRFLFKSQKVIALHQSAQPILDFGGYFRRKWDISFKMILFAFCTIQNSDTFILFPVPNVHTGRRWP